MRRHLAIHETPEREEQPDAPGARFGLWMTAAVVERRGDGREVEGYCDARNPLDGSGWQLEREVVLNESPVGEPVMLGSIELTTLTFADTDQLARVFPDLIEELLQSSGT